MKIKALITDAFPLSHPLMPISDMFFFSSSKLFRRKNFSVLIIFRLRWELTLLLILLSVRKILLFLNLIVSVKIIFCTRQYFSFYKNPDYTSRQDRAKAHSEPRQWSIAIHANDLSTNNFFSKNIPSIRYFIEFWLSE